MAFDWTVDALEGTCEAFGVGTFLAAPRFEGMSEVRGFGTADGGANLDRLFPWVGSPATSLSVALRFLELMVESDDKVMFVRLSVGSIKLYSRK